MRVSIAAAPADLRGWVPVAAFGVEHSLIERTAEQETPPTAARDY